MTSALLSGRHVVGQDDRRRQQHARRRSAACAPGSPIRSASGSCPRRCRRRARRSTARDVRQRRHEAGLDERHAARGHEIGRKPGEEEHLRRVAAELPDRRAEHLPVPQQRADVAPLEADRLPLVFAAAARLDVVELGLVDRRAARPDCDTAPTRRRPNTMPRPPTMKNSPRQPNRCVIQNSGTLRKPEPDVLPERVDRRWRGPARAAETRSRGCGCWPGSTAPRRCRRRSASGSGPSASCTTPISAVKSDQNDDRDEVGDPRPEPIEEDAARESGAARSSTRTRRTRGPSASP